MSRRLALIIGNSEYEDENLTKLVTPDADVHAFAQVLRDGEIGSFDEVIELVNQPSTAIRRAISNFFVGRQRDDLLLLYFSGHGIKDDRGQLFLGVKDTEYNLLRGTAIPAAFITEEMDNSRSRQQVLILDCCHSGAFSRGMKAVPGASVGTAAVFEGTGAGRVVLTASDSTQYAWEGGQVIGQAENSVFTHYLIQGLRSGEADSAGDGRITLDELYDYVYEQVVHATPKQTPSKWSYGQQGEIVIARNPHPIVKPVELSVDLQQTIEDTRPWVREGAVRELDRILQGGNQRLAVAAYQALKRLAEDDSRRVATMASETLAAYEKVQAAPEATGAVEITYAQPDRDEREQAIMGQRVAETVEAEAKEPVATISPAVVPMRMRWHSEWLTTLSVHWKHILMIAIVWGIGSRMVWPIVINFGIPFVTAIRLYNAVGALIAHMIAYAIAGALAGVVIALALQQTGLLIPRKQVFTITVGWSLTTGISWITALSLGEPLNLGLDFYAAFGVFLAIGWAISALVTVLALRQTGLLLPTKRVFMMVLGWIIGIGIVWSILWPVERISLSGQARLDTFIAANLVISSVIGSSVMFWQLDQVLRTAEKPS